MTREEIKEGDIVEIEYIAEFTKEHINEGRALVMWKGFNHQPLVRKLETKTTIWSNYEHIARVLGHIDIEEYMDKALEQEPKQGHWIVREDNTSYVRQLPRRWVECSHCGWSFSYSRIKDDYCSKCGARMSEVDNGNVD